MRLARKQGGAGRVFAVIKSNAYGHGLTQAAEALDAADGYAVALLEEAVILRQGLKTEAGAKKDILILQGFADRQEAEMAQQLNCICVIHQEWQAELVKDLTKPVRAWLKINTGMNRLGIPPEQLTSLLHAKGVRVEAIMTHLASANQADKSSAQAQIERFGRLTRDLSSPKSLANSAALLSMPTSRADINRPGLMLYGASPLDTISATSLGLLPAATLSGELISIRNVKAGETVGYDETWRAPDDQCVGVVSLGYGDGYPRLDDTTTAQVPVLVNNTVCYLAGRVSMDLICVDLGPQQTGNTSSAAKVGDTVVFWGKDLPVEKVAAATGRSPYDLLAGLTARLHRNYCD